MTKKSEGSEKAPKSSKRSKLASKPVKVTKMATTSAPPSTSVRRSSSAHASFAEGTRWYALAGRPSKADFIKVYGPNRPKMTWAQRATAGVDAKHFQEALKAKSRTGKVFWVNPFWPDVKGFRSLWQQKAGLRRALKTWGPQSQNG